LFKLLWNTEITWGDTLLLGDENGVSIEAAFILICVNGNYSAALWDINKGRQVSWDSARNFTRMAAYNEENNVWESGDVHGNWGGRSDCENWYGGGHPVTHYAEDLFIDEAYYEGDFFFTNYRQYNGWWYFGLIVTGGSMVFHQWWLAGLSSLYEIGTAIIDVSGTPFQGPKPVIYPVLQYDPSHSLSSPWQIGFSAP
jgi:hypothetical protein